MKDFCKLYKLPELEPHSHFQFCVMLMYAEDTICIFQVPHPEKSVKIAVLDTIQRECRHTISASSLTAMSFFLISNRDLIQST